MFRTRWPLLVAATALILGCTDQRLPTDPAESLPAPLFAITQGGFATAHTGDHHAPSLTITAPAVSAGDLLIGQVTVENLTPGEAICPPAGWTSVLRTNNTSAVAQQVFWRVASSAEAATPYTWRFRISSVGCAGATGSSSKGAVGGIIVYSGVDAVSSSGPVLASAGAAGDQKTMVAPSIVGPIPAGSRVVRFFGNDKKFLIATSGGDAAQVYSVNRVKSGATEKPSGAAADAVQAADGATGTVAGSNAGNGGHWVAQTVVLRMAAPTVIVDTLPGPSNGSAVAAIPFRELTARAGDYSTDHPDLPGFPLSHNTVMVTVAPDATLGQLNAVLKEFQAQIVGGIPGVANQTAGILIVRLPTNSHAELIPLLDQLRRRPGVERATPDKLLREHTVPRDGNLTGTGLDWTWTLPPSGGNWGLEIIRVPQMWNLNELPRRAASVAKTVVIDGGFNDHDDLTYELDLTPGVTDDHGTHVAGILAATFDNGVGVDGVNPFARLFVKGTLSLSAITASIFGLVDLRTDVRVINLSLGYGWSEVQIDTRSNSTARTTADTDGANFATMLATLDARGRRLPVIVATAGNDSDAYPNTEAKYASAYANAALVQGSAPIIVVEADSLDEPSASAVRAAFSNLGGHVSAPGWQILSPIGTAGYLHDDGTSMAAPHVTGILSYLYAIDPDLPAPTLTSNPIRDLLVDEATPVFGGAAPMVDAFATVMAVDRVRGTDLVLRALLDVDDGTVDGNTRVAFDGTTLVATEDGDGDGGPGDGRIDMADFRRWRDWLLQIEDSPSLDLDGPPDHPKRDLNGNHTVRFPAASENVFPRGDFNGDGEMHRGRRAKVPGVLNGQSLSDLEVLQARFDDRHYRSQDLDDLIDSGDFTVDARECRALPQVTRVSASIRPVDDTGRIVQQRDLSTTDSVDVFTVPLHGPGYEIRVEAFDNNDDVVSRETSPDFPLPLGGDVYYRADCLGHEIVGNVVIASDAELAGIEDVGRIRGDLEIHHVNSVDLRELPLLAEVTGTLKVRDAPNLVSLAGLVRLRKLGSLAIDTVPNFNDLGVLDSLTKVLVVLELKELPALATMRQASGYRVAELRLQNTAMVSLDVTNTTVSGIAIEKEANLVTLQGLKLPISGQLNRFVVRETPNLTDMGQLAGVTRVSSLIITKSGSAFFPGLSNLQTVLGTFQVQQVTGTAPFSVFTALDSVGGAFLLDPGAASTVTFPALRAVGAQFIVSQATDCSGPAQTVSFPALLRSGNPQPPVNQLFLGFFQFDAQRCPMTASAPALERVGIAVILGGPQLVEVTLPATLNAAYSLANTGLESFTVPAITVPFHGVDITNNLLLTTLNFRGAIDVPRLLIDNNPLLETVNNISGVVRANFIVTNNISLLQSDIDAWPLDLSSATVVVGNNKP